MGRPIDLAGFDARFDRDPDPWDTFQGRDETRKRTAILRALGPGMLGRVLELGSGNGSNSVALAAHALRLDATEGTGAGTRLTADALRRHKIARARALQLALPARFPRARYDAIVIAELLYYLDSRALASVAHETARTLRMGGRLVLAHHRIDFHDFAQHARRIHARFLGATETPWRVVVTSGTGRWRVLGLARR